MDYFDRGYEKTARFFDLFARRDDIEFYCGYAKDAGEILDIGAGTGRVAMPLAERGVKVVCVEPSPAMLAVFREKLAGNPGAAANITLIDGFAASFDLGRTVPAAFMAGAFDGFLDDAERRASVANVARHVDAGGVLVFDVWLGYMKEWPLRLSNTVVRGDREYRMYDACKLADGKTMEFDAVCEVYEAGELVERVEQKGWGSCSTRAGVRDLLDETGFKIRREFGGFDGKPYEEGDEVLVVEGVRV
jgi:SAM-dependent methyltransferase